MGVHGVGASAEVDVVRKVEPFFVLVYLRNLELKLEVAAQRVQLSVALLHFLQRLLELPLVVQLAGRECGWREKRRGRERTMGLPPKQRSCLPAQRCREKRWTGGCGSGKSCRGGMSATPPPSAHTRFIVSSTLVFTRLAAASE